MALVMPPPRTMSTLAISMIASLAGSMPVVSMSMTRINACAFVAGEGCERLDLRILCGEALETNRMGPGRGGHNQGLGRSR